MAVLRYLLLEGLLITTLRNQNGTEKELQSVEKLGVRNIDNISNYVVTSCIVPLMCGIFFGSLMWESTQTDMIRNPTKYGLVDPNNNDVVISKKPKSLLSMPIHHK